MYSGLSAAQPIGCSITRSDMKVKLDKFTYTWDMASLELLNSEFKMMDLLRAQKITNEDGSSILDDIVFYGNREVEMPESNNIIDYFKAPWSE